MAFLSVLFGKKDPLTAMEKAFSRGSWAEVLSFVDEIDLESLDPQALEHYQHWQMVAGDNLARFNLEEAAASLRGGDVVRASEHLQLAMECASSEEIRRQAQDALEADLVTPSPADVTAKAESCGNCTPQPQPQPASADLDLPDDESRFELLLAGSPEELTERYRRTSAQFREAFLFAHGGDEAAALKLWEALPDEQRDGLYWQEVGQAQLRSGDPQGAEISLGKALHLEPELATAAVDLAELLFAQNRIPEVFQRLEQMIAAQLATGYAYGRLALLAAREGKNGEALDFGLQALVQPDADGETLVLTASLLEKEGRLDEAEGLLQRLSTGGGCGGGGVHPLLAEFWLRRRKELNRAMEAFKSVLRREGENPRWHLRLAQTYLAKGWKREGLPMLKKLLQHPELPALLRQDGEAWLKEFDT